ncbi:hypothetical protein [Acinetobacter sp. ANC 4779]|nr:hypothetical protein [Acinetobacter sp. ANC 4779]
MTEDEELIKLAEQAKNDATISITIDELRALVQANLDKEKTK